MLMLEGGPCRHIVSSQVYGSKKASNKPADKWLALAVDYQMQQYPSLRVAYIDTVKSIAPGGKGTPMSVLLRWNTEEADVEECYRVRLPDQVEDGRGVVRAFSASSLLAVPVHIQDPGYVLEHIRKNILLFACCSSTYPELDIYWNMSERT
jgi:hypothetical protein